MSASYLPLAPCALANFLKYFKLINIYIFNVKEEELFRRVREGVGSWDFFIFESDSLILSSCTYSLKSYGTVGFTVTVRPWGQSNLACLRSCESLKAEREKCSRSSTHQECGLPRLLRVR